MADVGSNRENLRYANQELEKASESLGNTVEPLYGEDGDSGASEKAKRIAYLAQKLAELFPQLKDAVDDATQALPGLGKKIDSAQKLYTSAGMTGQVKESHDALFAARMSHLAITNAGLMLEGASSILATTGPALLDVAAENVKEINFSLYMIEGGINVAKTSADTALDIGNALEESL